MFKPENSDKLDRTAKLIFVAGAIVLTIAFASKIIIPIIFSGIFSVFLIPVVLKFEQWGTNRLFATLITVLTTTTILCSVVFLLGYESHQIISTMPEMPVEEILEEPVDLMEETMNLELSKYDSYITSAFDSAKKSIKGLVPAALTNIQDTLVFFITCPIYVFFMLLYSSNMKDFYFSVFSGERKTQATKILNEINSTYISYIKGMLIVIVIVSVLTSLGLLLLGLDYAIFLGILAGLLVLIPYIGVFISALIPLVIALVTKDSLWYPIGVVIVFSVVQFLEGNVITPKIVGDKVGLNPLVIIMGIIIFGAVAGVAGMIITIPILALFKIIAKHVPSWEPIRLLLNT